MTDQVDATIFSADQATTNSVIEGTDTNNTSTTNTQAIPESVSLLVGEGRKYKTLDDLAKAYLNADGFIEQLKAENQELRTKTVEAKTIDEVLERLSANQSNAAVTTSADQVSSTNGLSAQDVAKIVQQTVTGLETAKTRQSNILKADQALKAAFGDKATEVYSSVAKTPELNEAYMKLAAVDPDQFVALFTKSGQSNASTGSQVDSGSNVNTTTSYSSNNSVREMTPGTKEYFAKIRREDPKKYFSQNFQLELNKAAQDPKKYFGN